MDKIAAIVGLLLVTACSQSADPQQTARPQQSYLQEKLKCKEYGESQFEGSFTDSVMTFHNFYFSDELDTCVRETNTTNFDTGVVDVNEIIFTLNDMITGEVLIFTSSMCEDDPSIDKKCTTLEEYNNYKKSILD